MKYPILIALLITTNAFATPHFNPNDRQSIINALPGYGITESVEVPMDSTKLDQMVKADIKRHFQEDKTLRVRDINEDARILEKTQHNTFKQTNNGLDINTGS